MYICGCGWVGVYIVDVCECVSIKTVYVHRCVCMCVYVFRCVQLHMSVCLGVQMASVRWVCVCIRVYLHRCECVCV